MTKVALFRRRGEQPAEAWVVRDSRTHIVILSGTREECLSYVVAFGLCYADRA